MVLATGLCVPVWAEKSVAIPQVSVERLRAAVPGLSADDAERLRSEGMVRRHTEDQPMQFRFLPRTSLDRTVRGSFDGFSPNVVNEVLYLLPLPSPGRLPSPTDSRPASRGSRDDVLLQLYNRLRAVSTLSGVVYRSGRTGEDRVLFDDVYAIDSLRARNRLPDPLVTRIPAESRFYLHLVDANFGSSYFEASYFGAADAISFGMRNAQSLTLVVPVIRADRLRFHLVVVPLEDALLLYGMVGVEAGALIRRTVHLPSAFRNRIETLADWFMGNLY